jgi:hypothetical protein
MRLKIIRKPPGVTIDGIDVDSFELGKQYEMGNTLGSLFLAERWAEPVPLDAPQPPEPFGPNDPYDSRALFQNLDASQDLKKKVHEPPVERPAIAADTGRFRKRRPR